MADDNKELLKFYQEQLESRKKANNLSKEEEKTYKRIIASLKAANKVLEDSNDTASRHKKAWTDIGNAILNVPIGEYFKTVKGNVQDIAKQISEIQGMFDEMASNIQDSFSRAIPKGRFKTQLENEIKSAKFQFPEMGDELIQAIETGDITNFFSKWGEDGRKAFEQIVENKKGFKKLEEFLKKDGLGAQGLRDFTVAMRGLEEEAERVGKKFFDWDKAFKKVGDNILNRIGFERLFDGVKKFDNELSKIKREFQLPTDSFGEASAAMNDLVQKGTQFGLSTEDSFEMVKTLGEEARSTNVANLAATAKELAAIPAATGIASQQVSEIAGKMIRFGASADQAKAAFNSISKQALIFGVNVTKTSKIFADNLSRFQRMGFKAGEESLARMAAKAERVGLDLGKLMDASDKFLDINTALEASADLSLLGGAAAQTSFLDLMKAAQEGPEAMSKVFDQMTSDIGKLDKSGKLQLNMIDRQRLAEIAKATGEDVESLTNRINARLQDQAKKTQFSPNMFGSLSPEEREFLLSKTVKDKSGKFTVEGLDGVTDLKNVGRDQVKAMMDKAAKDAENAEKAAASRRSFDESIKALQDSFIALVNGLQPLLSMLTQGINFLVEAIGKFSSFMSSHFSPGVASFIKAAGALTVVLGLMFGPGNLIKWTVGLFQAMASPLKTLGSIGDKFKGIFSGKKVGETAEKLAGKKEDLTGGAKETPKKSGLLEQLKGISPAQILSVAAAIVALGVAFLLIGKGIQFASEGFATLVKAFNETKNAGMALAAVGIVMGGFVGMLALMIPIITALGAVSVPVAIPLIALGGAFLLMGAGVALASLGLAKLVESIGKVGKNIGNLFTAALGFGALAASLFVLSPALLLFGAAGLFAIPAMISLAAGLAIVSLSMKLITPSLLALSNIKSGGILELGNSLLPLAKGLLALVPVGVLSPIIILASGAALLAAGSVGLLAKSLSSLKGFDPTILSSFASSLTSLIVPLFAFSTVGIISPLLIGAGLGLMAITKGLSYLKNFDTKSVSEAPDLISNLVSALFKFSTVGIVTPLLVGAGLGLMVVSKSLTSFSGFDTSKLSILSTLLPNLGKGLLLFSIAGAVAPLIVLAALSLTAISKAFQLIGGFDLKKFEGLGSTLANIAPGLMLFSLAGVLAPGAMLAGLALTVITKAFSLMGTVDAKKILPYGNVLSGLAMPLLVFSAAGLLSIGAVMAAGALLVLSKSFEVMSKVDYAKIYPLGNILYSLAIPMILFSAAGALSGGIILAGISLATLAGSFLLFDKINFKNITDNLPSLLYKLSPALVLFSVAGLLSGGIILGAVSLAALSLPFMILQKVNYKNLESLPNLLYKLSPAIIAFGIASAIGAGSIIGAASLVLIGKSLSMISGVDFSNISNLPSFLTSISPALIAFGVASLLGVGASLGALSLIAIGKSISFLSTIDYKSVSGFASALYSLILPLLSFSLLGAVSPLLILTGVGIAAIAGGINSLSKVDSKSISLVSDSLYKLITPLLAFSIIGAVSPLLGLAGLSLIPLGLGLLALSKVNFANLANAGSALKGLILPLSGFAVIGFLSVPLAALGVALLSVGLGMAMFSKGLTDLTKIDPKQVGALSPVVDSLFAPLMKFAALGVLSPFILLSGLSLSFLGGSLLLASKGFTAFAAVPWNSLAGVAPILSSLLGAFMGLGFMGILAAPGIITIASTLGLLGLAMNSVTSGFANSAKAMADFNAQLEKLKANAKGVEGINVAQLQKINETAAGAPRTTTAVAPAAASAPQVIKIAPIQIDLKLNGRDMQHLIVEANYNRT